MGHKPPGRWWTSVCGKALQPRCTGACVGCEGAKQSWKWSFISCRWWNTWVNANSRRPRKAEKVQVCSSSLASMGILRYPIAVLHWSKAVGVVQDGALMASTGYCIINTCLVSERASRCQRQAAASRSTFSEQCCGKCDYSAVLLGSQYQIMPFLKERLMTYV